MKQSQWFEWLPQMIISSVHVNMPLQSVVKSPLPDCFNKLLFNINEKLPPEKLSIYDI